LQQAWSAEADLNCHQASIATWTCTTKYCRVTWSLFQLLLTPPPTCEVFVRTASYQPQATLSNLCLSSPASLYCTAHAPHPLETRSLYVTSLVSATLAQPCPGGADGLQDIQDCPPNLPVTYNNLPADPTSTHALLIHHSRTIRPLPQTPPPNRQLHSFTHAALPANRRHVRLR
jgi:hypothetical protein